MSINCDSVSALDTNVNLGARRSQIFTIDFANITTTVLTTGYVIIKIGELNTENTPTNMTGNYEPTRIAIEKIIQITKSSNGNGGIATLNTFTGGSGYSVGDTGTFAGGSGIQASYSVTAISQTGGVTSCDIIHRGNGNYDIGDVLTFAGNGDSTSTCTIASLNNNIQATVYIGASTNGTLQVNNGSAFPANSNNIIINKGNEPNQSSFIKNTGNEETLTYSQFIGGNENNRYITQSPNSLITKDHKHLYFISNQTTPNGVYLSNTKMSIIVDYVLL